MYIGGGLLLLIIVLLLEPLTEPVRSFGIRFNAGVRLQPVVDFFRGSRRRHSTPCRPDLAVRRVRDERKLHARFASGGRR